MAYRKKQCYLCGTKYLYCPTCAEDIGKPAYMATFHSESCAKIFEICTKFNMQLLTKEEAAAALEDCDLSNRESFRDDVKNDLKVILSDSKEPKKARINPAKHEVVTKSE